jgi:hypothetical protein
MPFTLSHPALVLPGYRLRYLDFTALVIGSMAPDMEYFFRRQAIGVWGHSPLGLLAFNLPLTIVVALLFHQIIKPALIAHLPTPYDRYYRPAQYQPWITTTASYWKIPLSAMLGAASHILWDSFTHRSGFFVKQLPVLQSSFDSGFINLPIYIILQYGFSLLGLLAIAVAVYRQWRQSITANAITNHHKEVPTHQVATNKWLYWTAIAIITLLSASLRSTVIASAAGLQWINEFLVGALSGLFVGLLIMGRWYLRHYH